MKKVILILLFVILSSFYVLGNTIAYWKFDEGSSNQVFDETANNNDGTISGVANWTTDSISGHALEFDGIDDKIAITKTSSVDLTDNVVLEAYVKRKSNTDGIIISKNGPYFLGIRDNVTAGGVYANDGNCPTSCITPGANTWTEIHGTTVLEQYIWYKLKMEYNDTNVNIYVNDILDGSASKIGQMPQVSQGVNLGWGEPGQNQFFTGIIDEAKISTINETIPDQDIEERLGELENRVDELEEMVEEQELLLQKIIDFIKKLPKGLRRYWE
ncbi:MAG: LamG-like jellyroll fold domain-containing protein [Nanoarchaeota archaeon]